MTVDCIVFEYDKEPCTIQVDPEQMSVYFGRDEKGFVIDRRIGSYSVTSPGKELKYLYVSNYDTPPTKTELAAAVEKLKPKPYEK